MKHLGDICKINGAEIEIVDVITGGSPCQDLSIAGKRAGLAGARSGLFMEQVRIVKEMREHDRANGRTGDMVRPRYMVWENVPGAFSSNKGKDFAAVLEEIARIAEPGFSLSGLPEKWKWTKAGAIDGDGWSIAWRTHNAKCWGKTIRDSRTGNVICLGTPQRRRRISVVADFGGESAAQIQFDRKSVSRHPAESGTARERLAGNTKSGASYAVRIRGGCDGGGKGALVQEDKSGTLGTGNDQTIFQSCITPWDCQSKRIFGTSGEAPTLQGGIGGGVNNPAIFCMATQQGGAELRTDDQSPTLTAGDRHGVAYISGVDGYNGDLTSDVASTIGVNCGMSTGRNGVMELSANENGSMARDSVLCAGFKAGQGAQAGGIGYSEEVSPTLAAAPSGTNQTPAVVALDMSHACDVIRDCGEIVPSLQARMGTGGNQVPLTYQQTTGTLSPGAHAGSYNGQDAYNDMLVCGATPDVAHALRAKANCAYREDAETYPVQNMVVRRLTPMECERLQGFPDGWTDIGEWRDSKGKLRKPSDSPRYKALGNSIALPFWDFLAKRISAQYLRPVTIGSLFDGIGGFPLVFERHNGKGTARWASEIDEFPIAVTKLRFGED